MIGFYRIRAAADRAGVSVKTLRRALKDLEHPLPAYRVGRKLLVIAERDLEAWMTVRRVAELPTAVDPKVRAFLGDLLQPQCNPEGRRRSNRKNDVANVEGDPLIPSLPPPETPPADDRSEGCPT